MTTQSTHRTPAQRSNDENAPRDVSRRDFLKLAWGALGAVALAEVGWMSYRFFEPKVVQGEFGGIFEAGRVEDFPPGSVTPFNTGRFYLVRLEDGGFLALYRKCTHLGCSVPWEQGDSMFICPCHASAFTVTGEVVNPPAPRALDRFPVTIENGIVKVDTGQVIRRDHHSPDDVVYA